MSKGRPTERNSLSLCNITEYASTSAFSQCPISASVAHTEGRVNLIQPAKFRFESEEISQSKRIRSPGDQHAPGTLRPCLGRAAQLQRRSRPPQEMEVTSPVELEPLSPDNRASGGDACHLAGPRQNSTCGNGLWQESPLLQVASAKMTRPTTHLVSCDIGPSRQSTWEVCGIPKLPNCSFFDLCGRASQNDRRRISRVSICGFMALVHPPQLPVILHYDLSSRTSETASASSTAGEGRAAAKSRADLPGGCVRVMCSR